jgi:predicted RecA/RadA family phage recombinase
MKNFVQSGEWALTVIAPAGGVAAGAIVIVGSIVGVAQGAGSRLESLAPQVYRKRRVSVPCRITVI